MARISSVVGALDLPKPMDNAENEKGGQQWRRGRRQRVREEVEARSGDNDTCSRKVKKKHYGKRMKKLMEDESSGVVCLPVVVCSCVVLALRGGRRSWSEGRGRRMKGMRESFDGSNSSLWHATVQAPPDPPGSVHFFAKSIKHY